MSARSSYLAWAISGPHRRPRWWRRRRRTVPRAPLLARACRALATFVGVSALALVLSGCEVRCSFMAHDHAQPAQPADASPPPSEVAFPWLVRR